MPTRLNRANAPPTLSRHAVDTARLAAPLAISQLSQMAMGVTDTILLGALGPDSLAAGGLGANLFFVVVVLLHPPSKKTAHSNPSKMFFPPMKTFSGNP